VAISDPATAHFTILKNLGNTSIAYKPRHTHTHTHPETLEAREKPRWQLVTLLICGGGQGLGWAVEPRKEEEEERCIIKLFVCKLPFNITK
jgi:hypothetical protein